MCDDTQLQSNYQVQMKSALCGYAMQAKCCRVFLWEMDSMTQDFWLDPGFTMYVEFGGNLMKSGPLVFKLLRHWGSRDLLQPWWAIRVWRPQCPVIVMDGIKIQLQHFWTPRTKKSLNYHNAWAMFWYHLSPSTQISAEWCLFSVFEAFYTQKKPLYLWT